MAERPALPDASLATPASKFRRAETSGRPSFSTTRTRIPLSRRKSATGGVAGATGSVVAGMAARSLSGSRVKI